jgi:hypothetical protein
MHYFVNEMLKLEMGSTQAFAENAQAIYEDNLDAYVRLIFRRPLAKLMVSYPTGSDPEADPDDLLGLLRGRRAAGTRLN